MQKKEKLLANSIINGLDEDDRSYWLDIEALMKLYDKRKK